MARMARMAQMFRTRSKTAYSVSLLAQNQGPNFMAENKQARFPLSIRSLALSGLEKKSLKETIELRRSKGRKVFLARMARITRIRYCLINRASDL